MKDNLGIYLEGKKIVRVVVLCDITEASGDANKYFPPFFY
jgi:hypothetical protein